MNNNSRKIMTAIIFMSVLQMGTVVISSILADIARSFPEVSDTAIQFLMTFPSLAVMAASIASAPLAGKIPKKYIASAGCFLFSLSGILSWLVHSSIPILFIWAGMMGAGIGLTVPMATSLIADCFPKERQPALMGWQSSASNAGGMLMTFIGGWLAGVHWSLTYLVYLIAVPGAVLALAWVPGNTGQANALPESEDRNSGGNILKAIIKPGILGSFIVALFGTMLFNNVPANISMFIAERSLGGPAEAGIASAILLMASALSGLIFGKVAGKIGKFVVVLGFGMMAAGQLICAVSSSLVILYVGCLIGGTSLSFIMPQKIFEATQAYGVRSETATMLTLSGSYLGAFATPLITKLASGIFSDETVLKRFYVSIIIASAAAVIITVSLMISRKSNSRRGEK